MKYADQRELVEGLRAMADFIEAHPELPISNPDMKLDQWLYDAYEWEEHRHNRSAREKLALVAKSMGRADKEFVSDWFTLTKKFGKFVSLEFTVNRSKVCRRVVTGTKVIPETVQPMKIIPERTEEVVEWVCDDPILSV